jgi:hypothetical protein
MMTALQHVRSSCDLSRGQNSDHYIDARVPITDDPVEILSTSKAAEVKVSKDFLQQERYDD